MSLREDIGSYIDAFGYISPHPVEPSNYSLASNNGVMYTSEYIIMLIRNKESSIIDLITYGMAVKNCILPNGMLQRVPRRFPSDQEGPDDYLGVLAACVELKSTKVPRTFLKAAIRYLGFLNNVNPGKWTGSSFLARQPQFLFSLIVASFPNNWNLLHILIRVLALPLDIATAIGILFSKVSPYDTTSIRLCWILVQITKNRSIFSHLAGLLWYKRLYKTFPKGMRQVAAIYYLPNGAHPFAKYWID